MDLLYRNSSVLKSNEYRKRILAEDIHDDDKEAYLQQVKTRPETEHVEKRDLGDK